MSSVASSPPPPAAWDDEIDLREVARALWRFRWIIVGVTLASALAAWLLSAFVLPKRYEASAYVVLHPWPTQAWNALPLPPPPDASSLASLAQEDGLLFRLQQEAVRQGRSKDVLMSWRVKLIDADGLRLTVVAPSPDDAAWLANRWAEITIEKINALYNLEDLQANLARSREQAWQAYQQAHQDYMAVLRDEQATLLQARLNALKAQHACVLQRLNNIDNLRSAVRELRARWEELPPEEQVPIQDGLLLLNLMQQGWLMSLCGLETVPLQLQITADGPALSAAEGLASLQSLETLLETQGKRLQAHHDDLEAQIAKLSIEWRMEDARQDEARRLRDWAWKHYVEIATREQTLAILRAADRPLADIGMHAVPPEKPISPRPLVNAVLAGFAGWLLSTLGVLLVVHWGEPAATEESARAGD